MRVIKWPFNTTNQVRSAFSEPTSWGPEILRRHTLIQNTPTIAQKMTGAKGNASANIMTLPRSLHNRRGSPSCIQCYVDVIKGCETLAPPMKNCVGTSIRAPCTLKGTFEDNAHTSVYPVRPLRSRRDSYTNTLRELYNGVFTLGSVKLVSRRDSIPEASRKPFTSDSVEGLSLCVDTSDTGCSGVQFMASEYSFSCQGPGAACATVYCGAGDQNLALNRHNFPRPARMCGSAGTP